MWCVPAVTAKQAAQSQHDGKHDVEWPFSSFLRRKSLRNSLEMIKNANFGDCFCDNRNVEAVRIACILFVSWLIELFGNCVLMYCCLVRLEQNWRFPIWISSFRPNSLQWNPETCEFRCQSIMHPGQPTKLTIEIPRKNDAFCNHSNRKNPKGATSKISSSFSETSFRLIYWNAPAQLTGGSTKGGTLTTLQANFKQLLLLLQQLLCPKFEP